MADDQSVVASRSIAPAVVATAMKSLPAKAVGAGRRGFTAADGTNVVVQFDRHDTVSDSSPDHIGIGVTAWEVDADGNKVGESITRFVHTAPMATIAAGHQTLDGILAICQEDAVSRVVAKKTVLAQMDALDLAPAPEKTPK